MNPIVNGKPHDKPRAIAWWQILLAAAAGILGLVGIGYLGWGAAGRPPYGQWTDLARAVPLLLAAVGALPAGYIAYRRQRTLEIQRYDDREKLELAHSTEQRVRDSEVVRQQELSEANRRADSREFQSRYSEVAAQFGSEKAAVRLAGVHATAKLIEDWGLFDPSQRQMCVDLLCGYMCLPLMYSKPEDTTAESELKEAETRVRETIVRLIKERLATSGNHWQGLIFDFTGANFPRGHWDFAGSTFEGGALRLTRVTLDEGAVVSFASAHFNGTTVDFRYARFANGSETNFKGVQFRGDEDVRFDHARFEGGSVNFGAAIFSAPISFRAITLLAGTVNFGGAMLTHDGSMTFYRAEQSGGLISFQRTSLAEGATITFDKVVFAGGEVRFEGATAADAAITRDGSPFRGTDLGLGS
jgi:hypothetical protein